MKSGIIIQNIKIHEVQIHQSYYSYSRCRVTLVRMSFHSFMTPTLQIISDADGPPYHGAKLSSIFSLGSPLPPNHIHTSFSSANSRGQEVLKFSNFLLQLPVVKRCSIFPVIFSDFQLLKGALFSPIVLPNLPLSRGAPVFQFSKTQHTSRDY